MALKKNTTKDEIRRAFVIFSVALFCKNSFRHKAISRRIEKQTRLIGWGQIVKGSTLDLSK